MADATSLLRKQIKLKIQALDPTIRTISSRKIATKIIHSEVFNAAKNIASYILLEPEVDVWTVIESIWAQGKNCYLPALLDDKNYLCFVKFSPGAPLQKGRFGILEPEFYLEKMINPKDLDLVIVPLLGFTRNGFRLGHGSGCYDRTFAFKQQTKSLKPYLLGVGYQCQQVEFLPQVWDVAMDEVVTDSVSSNGWNRS